MCSAMAPGPCKATHGSGQGSRGQRCFPLPSEDPEHPPPPRRQERTALHPPWEPRCRPSARGCGTKPSAARPAAAQRSGPRPPRGAGLCPRGYAPIRGSGGQQGRAASWLNQQCCTRSARCVRSVALPALIETRAGAGRAGRPPGAHWSGPGAARPSTGRAGGTKAGPLPGLASSLPALQTAALVMTDRSLQNWSSLFHGVLYVLRFCDAHGPC